MKNIFAECQFSEKLLGNYLFRAIKKNVYDSNTIIFEETPKSNSINSGSSNNNNLGIKEIEIVENNIVDIIQDNGKVPMIQNTSDIFKKVMENKKIRNEMANYIY